MREAELVENYMKLKGNSQIKAFKEIGYRQKKIDIVEFNLDSEEYIHGIEFKIKNWKKRNLKSVIFTSMTLLRLI